MKRILQLLAVMALGLAAYLAFWPVPVEPVAWTAPPAPGYTGPHAPNTRLAGLRMIALGDDHGPEHVMLGPDGKLYVAVASGRILRMAPDGSGLEVFASTGGRVLGFDFDAQGRLIAADAFRGLLAIGADRQPVVLADQVGGDPIRYADGVVVARDGMVFFTDASTRFGAKASGGTFEASVLDILEQAASGRVLAYDPATRATRVVARGLAFPNGIALSQDGSQLFVAETGKYRVWKLPVGASNLDVGAGSSDAKLLFDNLPGYPDNLMRGLDGKLWMGLVKPRNPTIDKLADKPFLRKLTLRLPRAMWPVPKAYGHVVAFTEDGKVVADLQDPSGAYPETTAVAETADRLYIQSLHAKDLGWMPRPR
jgi:sugar lactone lactonase YvrE